MKKSTGILVQYVNKEGKIQKGIARYSDQLPQFKAKMNVCVRLIGKDLKPITDQKGYATKVLVNEMKLSTIGFID